MSLLKIEGLHKQYGDYLAVNNVSIDVPKQSIFGLLGPNGAGKTSLIRIITSITGADEGKVYFNGQLLNERTPSQIGYMPEERGLYKKMKVGEQLLYLARLKGMSKKEAKSKIDYWLEKFQIQDWWNKAIEELSKGMQQKIQFISTVVHEPELLILDEPFSGLDPINANLIKDEIFNLNKNGTTIIFSTHRMEQVEEICEEIVLINQGKNILQGKLADIKQQFKKNIFELKYEGDLPTDFDEGHQIIEKSEGKIKVQIQEDEDSNKLLKEMIELGIKIHSFEEILPSINEIFIEKVQQ